ncbi:TPA: hypothetical protein ACGGS8_003561 [Vibrio cholerae]
MYVIRFLGIIAVTVSANCYAYSISIFPQVGIDGFIYYPPSSIPADYLPEIGSERSIPMGGTNFAYQTSNQRPSVRSYWGCWGGKTDQGLLMDATDEGYIKTGNDDYVIVFGANGYGNAICESGKPWIGAAGSYDQWIYGHYIKLRRIAKTGDTSPINFPRIYICLMPDEVSGSDKSKCDTYSSAQNNKYWYANRSSVTPEPPPSACTARVTVNGSPVMDGGTIQLETISTYGTIGVPPSTLYTGKSFAIEPVNGPGENCQDFTTSKVTFRYDEVLSHGVSVVRSNSPDVGFVIKRNDTRDYVKNGTQMSFSDLEPKFKVNYWSLTSTAGAGAFSSGTVTIDIIYN